MLNTVFLFYGENTYTLYHELQRWKTSFLDKYGQDSLFHFNSLNWDDGSVKQALFSGGLFVSKKLIIIEGVPKDLSQDIGLSTDKIDKFIADFQENLRLLTDDTIVIFVSSKPDKRTKAFKWFTENVQLKSFDIFKEPQLKTFVQEHVKPSYLGEEELDYFLLKVGTDLYRLDSEIEKLKFLFPQGTTLTKKNIDDFCFGMVEADAFSIFDHIFVQPNEAVRGLKKMQDDGKAWNEVNGLLVWELKIYLTLLDYDKQGIRDAKYIISETKMHPFVISKNLKNLDTLKEYEQFIKQFFKKLIDLEYGIKSGRYPDQYFWLAIKQSILSLC